MANLGQLMIDEEYLKESSFVDENVDMKILNLCVWDAQRLKVLPVLGTALYNEIIGQIEAGTLSSQGTTLTNRALVRDYIAPALLYWTLYDAVDIMSFSFSNKGVMRKRSEESNPAETEDLKRLKAFFADKAEAFDKRTMLYLLANNDTFTLYLNPGTSVDTISPKRKPFFSGIYLGNRRNKDVTDEMRYENPRTYGCD